MVTKESLIVLSDNKLAELQKEISHLNPEHVLIEQEWQRRSRLEQHNLNLKIFEKQTKWTLFSALLGIIGVIVGVYLSKLIK